MQGTATIVAVCGKLKWECGNVCGSNHHTVHFPGRSHSVLNRVSCMMEVAPRKPPFGVLKSHWYAGSWFTTPTNLVINNSSTLQILRKQMQNGSTGTLLWVSIIQFLQHFPPFISSEFQVCNNNVLLTSFLIPRFELYFVPLAIHLPFVCPRAACSHVRCSGSSAL